MSQGSLQREGLCVTVGIETDDHGGISCGEPLLDPPLVRIRFLLENRGSEPSFFRFPSDSRVCFQISDPAERRVWSYPGHTPWNKATLTLMPGETLEHCISFPWEEVFLQKGQPYRLIGWLSRRPDLSVSVPFRLVDNSRSQNAFLEGKR